MAKTNLELAIDAVGLIRGQMTGFDLFTGIDENHRLELMKSTPERLYKIFSILKDAYAPKVELESIVEIAEQDKDWFDKAKFRMDDMVIFEGKEYDITGVDFDTKEIEIWYNESNLWLNCTECIYLPKK